MSALGAKQTGAVMARIVGTSGNDVLRGTSHRDVIIGKGGKDVIIGKGGNDKIRAGDGRDTVKGNSGNDVIKGGGGGDKLIGGNGNDTIKGQGGRDNIKGNSGDDNLYGNKGADKIFGAKGADDLWGGGGPDVFKFKAGDGFHDGFPNAPSPGAIFDDVIHDFSGLNDPINGNAGEGQGDQLHFPGNSLGISLFNGGLAFIYHANGDSAGSIFVANTQFYADDDLIF
jgi:Ca2+-binding RTX toxin-like protein